MCGMHGEYDMATIEQVLRDLGIDSDSIDGMINSQEDMMSGRAKMPCAIPTDVSREPEGGYAEELDSSMEVSNEDYAAFHARQEAEWACSLSVDEVAAINDDGCNSLNPEDLNYHDVRERAQRALDASTDAIMTTPYRFMRWCENRRSTDSYELEASLRAGHELRIIQWGTPELNDHCAVSLAAFEEARHCNPEWLHDLHILGNRAWEWHQLIHGFMGDTPDELAISLEMLSIEYVEHYEDGEDHCWFELLGTKYKWCIHLNAYQLSDPLLTPIMSMLPEHE